MPALAEPGIIALSPEACEQFRRVGYLTLPAMTSPEEIATIRVRLERLFAARAGWANGDLFDYAGIDGAEVAKQPQLTGASLYDPALAQTRFHANARAVAKRLLGAHAVFCSDHAVLKPVGSDTPTPWHQDQAFWPPWGRYPSITIWMPLQDTPADAGCLRFVPGSHRQRRILPHRSMFDDPRFHALEAIGADDAQAITCPLRAGEATVHHHRTLHGAGPNRTDTPRLAYALVFGLRPLPHRLWHRLGRPPLVPHLLSRVQWLVPGWRDYSWNRGKQTARRERARRAQAEGGSYRRL
jgi:phytanoyl-CoA dioxygenase PhyH